MKWRLPWCPFAVGATIATLVMFPLVNALAVDHGYWLHWRTQDTLETVGAWLMLSAIVIVTIGVPEASARMKTAESITAIWLLIGSFFFFGAVVKTGALHDFATRHRVASPWIAAALGGLFLTLTIVMLARVHQRGSRPFQCTTLTLSPLVLVFLFQLGNAQWWHREPRTATPASPSQAGSQRFQRRAGFRTVVLLFDELSPDFLYGGQAGALEGLPALRGLIAASQIYSHAYLPGGATRTAIPTLFQTRRLNVREPSGRMVTDREMALRRADEGWLSGAVEKGLDVRVFGWYLDYCTGIAAIAASCKAVSLYNPRTLGGGPSLIHPLWTTLNLLPAEMPFGIAKIRPAVLMHQATYDAALAWTHAQIDDERADVIYVHVNVPHVPFFADDFTYQDRFVVTRDRYVRQLRYVDAFVAHILSDIVHSPTASRRSRLIVMSDHNVRGLTSADRHERVVFMTRSLNDAVGQRDERPVNAADLLARLVLKNE